MLPSQGPFQEEILEVDRIGIGLELTRLVDLELKPSEKVFAEVGVQGEIAAAHHQPGSPLPLLGVEACHVVEITEDQTAKAEDRALLFLGGCNRHPKETGNQTTEATNAHSLHAPHNT